MKQQFIEKAFTPASMAMIVRVNSILDEYARQGFRLSLRQLYYQLVSRAIIDNTLRSYKNLGNLVSDARQAGLVDWDRIEDRNRETVGNSHWDNPGQIVRAAARSFRIDKWENQPYYIEAMVEKDALSGVLQPVCSRLDIPITANKGYSSSSTMYEIGQRLSRMDGLGKKLTVLYLGDHDPSGLDMTRDVEDRLRMYSEGCRVEVIRLALNWDQIEVWRPPENPAKTTDSRSQSYIDRYGESSWELDAVEPRELARLVQEAVDERLDDDIWEEALAKEKAWRDELDVFAKTFRDGAN